MRSQPVRRLTDAVSLPELLERRPRRPGSPTIRAMLDGRAEVTRSELEARFLDLLSRAGLPRPEVNAWVQVNGRWIECDCVWRAPRLVAELDGHASHGTRRAFERDRARDRALQGAGWQTVRVTWRQLREEARLVASDFGAILNRASL